MNLRAIGPHVARSLRRLLAVLALVALGCAGHRFDPSLPAPAPTPPALLETLDARARPGESFEANLYIEFEGGFLGERSVKINGQMVCAWPDRVRLVGAYGAFKKLFDLLVEGDEFRLYDHEAHTLYVGHPDDPAAARELGLAVRPGDLPRLLRLGGRGPLDGANVLSVRAPSNRSIEAIFEAPGDSGRWVARYDTRSWRLGWLERWVGAERELRVDYERYSEIDGRPVPMRIEASGPGGRDRVRIEVRSLAFRDSLRTRSFRQKTPEDAAIEHVGSSRKALPTTPAGR